ncbi:MAG: radical SAM protein [Euryarchaeota archaeon]|nr:radical SAM protein [Euryarchaeota archaeon]
MLEFKTSKGNMYALDYETGIFIPFSKTMKAILNEISNQKSLSKKNVIEILKKDYDEEEIAFYYDWIKKWEQIRVQNNGSKIPQNIRASDIKDYLLKSGLNHLILCVTEDCNLRCKYCVYSSSYEHTRNHSDSYMDYKIAKKAIDYYLSILKLGEIYNPLRRPSIGFYGGEPLLNFKIIKDCVEYIENKYKEYETQFTITTNGTLLDKEKADWLMDHDFIISVSIDGPEEEHNRLRIYSNGEGTFNDVSKNVGRIMDVGYEKIFSIPVFDWKSDLFKIEEFFNKKDVPAALTASQVDYWAKTRYYEQYTKKDYLNFQDQLKKAKIYYFENIDYQRHKEKESFFDCLVGQTPGRVLFDSQTIIPSLPIMPFTGSCIPGRKIFVDVCGNYHMCERVNESFPIGNVDEGLNFEKISKLINEYVGQMDKCPSCKIKKNCNRCFKHFMVYKRFLSSSKVCKKVYSLMKDQFVDIFEIAEIHPDFVDESNSKHKNIKKYYGE